MTIRVTCSQKRFGRIMGSVAAAVVLVLLVYSTPATALPPRMDTASPFGTKAWKTAPPAWTTSGATRVSPRSPGTLLWDDRFDQAGSFDLGVAIAASDDAVAWTGGTLDAAFNEDVVVQTLAPRTGAVRWQRTFDYQGSSDEGQSIAIDGGVVVVGVSASSSNGDSDWVLLAYDLRTGA